MSILSRLLGRRAKEVVPAAESFRSAALRQFPVGEGQSLVSSAGSMHLLPASIADALIRCHDFAPLEEHARARGRERRLDDAEMAALRDQLADLAKAGLLVSRSQVLQTSRDVAGDEAPRISVLGILTRDRVQAVARALESHLASVVAAGRSPGVVVIDSSVSAGDRAATRAHLRDTAARHGLTTSYVGPEQRERFIGPLASAAGVDPELVRYALEDVEGLGNNTGAAHNAMLLHGVGDMIFSADDDTIARAAPVPGAEEGLRCVSTRDPTEFWFHPDRESVLQHVPLAVVDILGEHERLLGRTPAACVAAAAPADVLLDRISPDFLRQLLRGHGRVLATLNALAGDSGMSTSAYFLTRSGSSRQRLIASPSAYRSALTSREIVRGVQRRTISDGTFFMTALVGLDNRDLLPPFFPVMRNQDSTFGFTLRACFEGFVGFLPRTLLHSPLGSRRYAADDGQRIPGISYVVMAAIGEFDPGALPPGRPRFEALGRYLAALGELPAEDFEEWLRLARWRQVSDGLRALERLLAEHHEAPAFWAEDVRRRIDALEAALTRPDQIVPADLMRGRDEAQVRPLTRRLVAGFGRLLEAWPSLIEAARRLRAEGVRLGEPP